MMAPGFDPLDGRPRALKDGLDSSVGQVAHLTHQAGLSSFSGEEDPEAHSLYHATDHEATADNRRNTGPDRLLRFVHFLLPVGVDMVASTTCTALR
jgi:hypothetical protein